MKEMEVGVKDVKWRPVGAWTTGLSMEKNIMSDQVIAELSPEPHTDLYSFFLICRL